MASQNEFAQRVPMPEPVISQERLRQLLSCRESYRQLKKIYEEFRLHVIQNLLAGAKIEPGLLDAWVTDPAPNTTPNQPAAQSSPVLWVAEDPISHVTIDAE